MSDVHLVLLLIAVPIATLVCGILIGRNLVIEADLEPTPIDDVMDAFRPIAEEMVGKSGACFASVDRTDCFGIVATGSYADTLREVARQLPQTGNNDEPDNRNDD